MTKRDFYKAVVAANLSAEMSDMANKLLSQLDATNERRKTSPATQRANAERDAFRAQLYAALTDEPQSAKQIAELCGCEPAKVSSSLRLMDGVRITDFKPTGKGRTVHGYSRG